MTFHFIRLSLSNELHVGNLARGLSQIIFEQVVIEICCEDQNFFFPTKPRGWT